MANNKFQVAKRPSPYELLGIRIRKVINSTKAQETKNALLVREDTDSPENWDRLVEEIGENENVIVTHRGDSAIHVSWTPPQES